MLLGSVSAHGCPFGWPCSKDAGLRSGTTQTQSCRAYHLRTKAFLKDVVREAKTATLHSKHTKELETRIREQLQNVELSPSSYDTAWVAMVPARGSPQAPRFPQYVEWILQNQHGNGSWGLNHLDPLLNKDTLSSTLACVLALKRWNVGDEHIRRGLHFIGNNSSCIMDENCITPIGFNIIFPGMLGFGIDMGLEFPLSQTDADRILCIRDMELKREARGTSSGRKAYMAYVAEGLGNLQDWNEAMAFQRKNGSLFNSPSTTAAVSIHSSNARALEYLDSLSRKFGSSVPAAYPLDVYSQLCMVDTLENVGISRHYAYEIKSILDRIYSCWLQKDEEIMLDMTTSAMAFRLLRMNGYDVSSDELSHVAEESDFHDSLQGYLNDTTTLLELYKASHVNISENDLILDKIGSWSGKLLKQQQRQKEVSRSAIPTEVDHVLKYPFYATLDRLEHRRYIENYNTKGTHMLKSAYLACRATEDILALAVDEFHSSQALYQEELEHLESWLKETRFDELEFVRLRMSYCHFSGASCTFAPEHSDARIAWAKNCVLVTAADDFLDVGGTREECANLVALIEKWDRHHEIGFCSKRVELLFSAIYNTTNQIGAKAAKLQNQSVIGHIARLWLDFVSNMLTEAEWRWKKYVPTFEEYLPVAAVTFTLGAIIPGAVYFLGTKLSDDAVLDPEYDDLLMFSGAIGRLLNDLQSYVRESSQGKINSVLLRVFHGDNSNMEEAKEDIKRVLGAYTRRMLRLVLKEGTIVPKPCKQMYWNMCKVMYVFYFQADGYTSLEEMVAFTNAVIHEPLKMSIPSSSIVGHQCQNKDIC